MLIVQPENYAALRPTVQHELLEVNAHEPERPEL